jgi:GDP-L-fucose synthase
MKLENKKILLTGGTGFFGKHLATELQKKKPNKIIIPRSQTADLREIKNCLKVTKDVDILFHLAGHVGGIGFNQKKPGEIFYNNAIMGLQIIEAARINQVKKVVIIGTICSYPKYTTVPFKETDFWEGYPEETNASYGLAKKMLLTQLQAYRNQYGFNGIFLLPANLYGPHDNFSPQSSHVIPSLIQKMQTAIDHNTPEIKIWGDGSVTREFFYVEDAAKNLVLSSEMYNSTEPLNLGNGSEISIKDLAEKIGLLMGYTGRFLWDTTQPQGQLRRCLDTTISEKLLNFKEATSLEQGLQKTIDWYRHRNSHDTKKF